MENPYIDYAKNFQNLARQGKSLPYGNISSPPKVELKKNAPIAIVISPHPDDECIMGALPLRLMREVGIRVVVCAITLGSNKKRQKERLNELKKATEWIGFELVEVCENGFENITPLYRNKDPKNWAKKITIIKNIFEKWNPSVIFFPNSNDWNQTHLGVNTLTMDTLSQMDNFFPFLIETEYWGQMPAPNLLVESSADQVADLLGALSHHKGELQRNPFHLRMPGWMQDNVRRGAEVIGGQGNAAPDFDFATLYSVNRWNGRNLIPAWRGGKILPIGSSSDQIIEPSPIN